MPSSSSGSGGRSAPFRLPTTDDNPATAADTGWTPLLTTPNHQEYPSGHGGLSGAAARVLARVFGDKTAFTHRTDTAPFAPRAHKSFSSAADEANDSRVYGGIHFRTAVRDGRAIGDSVGRLVTETLMQPLITMVTMTTITMTIGTVTIAE